MPLYPFLGHQGRCRIYINPTTWHHIFIVLATILDHNKCCRNVVEDGIKWKNVPNEVAGPKMGVPEKIISQL